MASNRWIGNAGIVPHVFTIAISAYDVLTTYKVTMNGKVVSVLGSGGLTSTVATALTAALAASEFPEFAEVTWESDDAVVTGTGPSDGRPVAATSSVSGGTGTIGAFTTTTTPSSPEDVSLTANWSTGALPVGACTAPVQAAAVAIAGGSLVDTTQYFWVVTALNANGETVASNEQTLTIAAPDQTATLSWAAVISATGYKVYRGTTTGVYTNKLVATLGAVTTYDDTGTATGAGTPPGASTAVGDDVYFEHSSVSAKWNLSALSAITLKSLTVDASYTGEIGLPETNADGVPYDEYRATYLALGATTQTIDAGGTGRVKIDNGAAQTALTVLGTRRGAESDLEAVQWKGTHASNVVSAYGGELAVAGYGGDVSTVATLNVAGTATVRCGAGATLATVNLTDASLDVSSALTILTMLRGTATVRGTAGVTTLVCDQGAVNYLSSGTIVSATMGRGSTLDFSGRLVTRTVATCNVHAGAAVKDPFGRVTFSNGITLVRCGLADVSIDVGQSVTITPS